MEARVRSRWLRRLGTAALAVAGLGYGAAAALLYVGQDRLVFVPAREIDRTPADAGLAYEPVTIRASDGEEISAWWIPAERSRGVVLYHHGNAGNLSNRVPAMAWLVARGVDVLIYDYHGYGDSTGEPGEQETYLDARAAWDHLTLERGIPPEKIVSWGRSLGGAVAVWLATQVRPAGLVVESSFTSIPDTAAVHYPFFPVRWLGRHEYPSLSRLGDLAVPVLVAHGPDDTVVPYEQGRALFAAAPGPKTFVELPGDHNAPGLCADIHQGEVEAFLDRALGRP